VWISDRVFAAVEDLSVAELVGDLQPKGFSRAVRVHNVRDLDDRQVKR
jgi:adenylate cyclase